MDTTYSEAVRGVDAQPARYGPLSGLAWLHFINDGAANFLPGVLPAILVAQGRSPALAGTLMFVLLAGQGLQPVAGLLGGALGGRRLMWIGVVGALVGAGLVGFAGNLAWLLVVLALIGLANACFHPQALAAARVYAGGRGHFGMAIMLLGGEIGRGLWPLVASAVVAWGSLSRLWVPALIALVSVPLVQRLLPAPRAKTREWRVRLRGRLGATSRLLAYVVLRGLVVIGATAYLPILWQQLGGGLVVGAALVTTMLIVGLVGTLYGGHLADRVGRRPVLAVAGGLMAAGLALVASGNMADLWGGAAGAGRVRELGGVVGGGGVPRHCRVGDLSGHHAGGPGPVPGEPAVRFGYFAGPGQCTGRGAGGPDRAAVGHLAGGLAVLAVCRRGPGDGAARVAGAVVGLSDAVDLPSRRRTQA